MIPGYLATMFDRDNTKPATPATCEDAGTATYGETLTRLLSLLARARRLLDVFADTRSPDPFRQQSAEKIADQIAALIGHPVTGQHPAPEVTALVDYLDDDAPTITPWGGDGCDINMVHAFGPGRTPPFDADGHPPNCPAHLNLGPSRRAKSRESAPRTDHQQPPAAGQPWDVDPALIAQLRQAADRWGALGVALTAARLTDPAAVVATLTRAESREPAAPVQTPETPEAPEARAARLDREARAAGAAYRRALQAADQAHRAIGGRP